MNNDLNQTYPFKVPPLPYAYNGLEPNIDAKTVEIHHDRHLKTYVDNLNAALKDHPDFHDWTLNRLLINLELIPEAIRTAVKNNGGGVYNHIVYFDMMTDKPQAPPAEATQLLEQNFGSYDNFVKMLSEAAVKQFGSGYGCLAKDAQGKLDIFNLCNQDTPLAKGLTPLLLLDVWEHAYYLKYQNLRADYVENWFNLIDWAKFLAYYPG